MRLRVTYEDGEAVRIERPQTIAANRVAFEMDGSTAVWVGRDAKDLAEVVEAVEALCCVQAVSMEVESCPKHM